jgi:hypothetical protein
LGPAAWAKCIGHDTRLDRDVAIKILPEAFKVDAERNKLRVPSLS